MPNLVKKLIAEFIGTFALVVFGCGVAVMSGDTLTTALAFGLILVVMYYTIGKISGCHINPAVTVAMMIKKVTGVVEGIGYIIAQVIGGIAGAGFLKYIATTLEKAYIENYYTQQGYPISDDITDYIKTFIDNLGANTVINDATIIPTIILEVFLTFVFVLVICKVVDNKKYSKVGGFVIGLALALVHLLGIPFTGTSVNPARSIGPAIFMGGDSQKYLWIFILAPIVGGILAALVSKFVLTESVKEESDIISE